ncbi:hypothetical protein MKS83_11425 [Chryseobacterium sp. Y16C]|uniref:hypothetical protein n=1 Tax=Chryseobacterium sp. Y16C TaxID=2920939 RepID=UPI001F0A6122|nr:hypothetical protein [Chryseobacterium sp. Y16C]UMQ40024.1 hypothetical protein MKS83_11425 [Chryseobacterium sp. Y16C]
MTSFIKILFSSISLTFYTGSFAQTYNVNFTLPQVALMDIEQNSSINLDLTKPTEAGNRLANPANNTTKWLNYTSAVASGGTRSITASINQLIPGVDVKLQAAAASGSGAGTLGTPSSQVTLSTVPTTIISGIGGAYTGNGIGNGHQLTFSVSPNTYTNLNAFNNTVTVTYTITDNGVSPSANIPVNIAGTPSAIIIPPITEAGNNYSGTYTSSDNTIILGPYTIPRSVLLGLALLETGSIVSQIKMYYTPTLWNNSLHLYANRNGGTGAITGLCLGCSVYFNNGNTYPEILQTDSVFFDLMFAGTLGLLVTQISYSNIPISIRLGGVSVTVPAATYTAQINFHQ